MKNARALSRVRRDLAAGHPRAAVRRLRTMLAASPGDLEVYGLLAEVHRTVGNAAEAGRWGYLTGDVTEDEIAAIERAHPQPWIRLQLLGWPGGPEGLTDEAARARLTRLHQLVSQTTVPLQQRRGDHDAQSPQKQHLGLEMSAATSGGTTTAQRQSIIPAQRSALEPAQRSAPEQAQRSAPQQAQRPAREPAQRSAPQQAQRPAAEPAQRKPMIPRQSSSPGIEGLTGAGPAPAPAPGTTQAATSGQPTETGSTSGTARETSRRPGPTRTARRQPERSFAAAARNYLILLMLILCGSAGSVIAVGGIRALFGVKNWLSPVTALFHALVKLFTS